MTDNYIQINDDDLVVLKIKKNGKETGEQLTFDMNDMELPLLYQDMIFKIQKNKEKLQNDFRVIEKREDVKGKKLFSKNEEDKFKAFNEYMKKMEEAYNMFLGPDGVKKLLDGRKLGFTTLAMIDDIIEKQIAPHLELTADSIIDKIKNKYGSKDKEELK